MSRRPPGPVVLRRFVHTPELDALRGIAVTLVVLSHLWIVWPDWYLADDFASGGFLGVDLFFVLSGFLVTVLLLDEQARTRTVDLLGFYRRRAVRIFPALWVALGAHALYAVVEGYPPFGRADLEWQNVRAGVLGYFNWNLLWNPEAAGDLTPVWSLAIELQFYAAWPIVVLLLLGIRRHGALVTTVLGGLILAVYLRRLQVFETEGWYAAYLRTDARLDGLLVGALAATAWVRCWTPARLPRWLLVPAAATGATMIALGDAAGDFTHQAGITLFLAASAVAVLVVVSGRRAALGPAGRVLAVLGRVSYGIYLYHFAVFWAFARWHPELPAGRRTALAALAVAGLTVVSWFLVERPTARLRGRKATSTPQAAVTP